MKILETKLFNQEFLDKWYSHFHQLEAYSKQKQNNPLPVPMDADDELAQWIRIQRGMKIMLPTELKNKLAAINFDFDEQDNTWDHRCQQLAAFVQKYGHTCLPADEQKYEALRDWLIRQIHDQKFLSESQYQRLHLLGVDWEMATSRDHRWERMFIKLKEFRKIFGHCRVPQGWIRDKQLAAWVAVQRRMGAANSLRPDRQRRLEELNFLWNIKTIYDSQWEQHYQRLETFYKTHGHCKVPGSYKKLTSWIENQRTYKKNNLLLADREGKLNALGFIWGFSAIKEISWNERYKQLQAYKQQHGHCFVPVNGKAHKSLGQWVGAQRRLEAKNQLQKGKKEKLSRLGFVWSPDTRHQLKAIYDTQWKASFEKLKAYQQAHGSCQVSLKIDPKLQQWTRWQRIQYGQGRLSKAREQQLNGIGFPWNIQEGYWLKMYKLLSQFYDQFGHCRVPSGWAPNPRLAAWVYHTKKNKTRLAAAKIDLLNQIGFDWVLHPKTVVSWDLMYDRLLAFKQAHGHTRVPLKWREDPKLGKWVSRMRYEKESLYPERASRLKQIAFDWGRHPKPAISCG